MPRVDPNAGKELSRLVKDLGKLSADLKRQLRPALRRAAEPIVRKARANASYSTRIPQAVKLQTRLVGGNPGVRLVANVKQAPHARVMEYGDGRRTFILSRRLLKFRHPVFGNREKWVDQDARPYIGPALDEHKDNVARAIDQAVVTAAKRVGFR